MPRTFGSLIAEARTMLQDKVPTDAGEYRYSDAEMFEAINGAVVELRTRRPDLFLPWGLRNPMPQYTTADMAAAFPLDLSVYMPMIYYVCGRCELREDTFGQDSRAVVFLNKFVSMILTVQA